jgi:hypothetical protein
VASGARLGEPVGGPLGDIYGRFGLPRGLTLSFAGSVLGERTVTWLTSGDMAVPSRVQFGPVPVKATQRDIDSGSYLVHDVAGWSELAPQGRFDYDNNRVSAIDGEVPVRVHRATMAGIPEGTRIAYRVGSPDGWSDVRTFEASPRRDQGFRFTHFGDHATHVASRRNTAAVLARRPAFHLLAGDIAYADGWQPQWDRWANEIELLTASVPLVTSPGNHEGKDFYGATYRARFSHPNPGRNWFSFDHHNVHILSVTAGAFLQGHVEHDRQTLIDPYLDPRQIDEFRLVRKPQAVIRDAALPPRSLADVVRDVPEAKGIVVPNLAEDCTRHRHGDVDRRRPLAEPPPIGAPPIAARPLGAQRGWGTMRM